MIVDCHTHIWSGADELDAEALDQFRRQSGRQDISADPAAHALSAECVDKSLIIAATGRQTDGEAGNDLVAEYVTRHSGAMIGIACVDPTDADAARKAEALLDRPEFRGLAVSPADQEFHPSDTRAMALYELAVDRSVPLLVHQGAHFGRGAHMEYARPSLLDEVARQFADLRMVISSIGQPWMDEGIALIGKHPHVFADISGLIRIPWQLYNGLVAAHQFRVTDKLLFGSGFPCLRAAEAIERVYRLHEITQGTNLPAVPREALRSIIERDCLEALGIEQPGERTGAEATRDERQ